MLNKQHKQVSYIISNDGFVAKVSTAEAEEKVDNKRWFYTVKSVYKHTANGTIRIDNKTLIKQHNKKDYVTQDNYIVLYIMYPPRNINWDKRIKANQKQELINNRALQGHRQLVTITTERYDSLEPQQQVKYKYDRLNNCYSKIITHFKTNVYA